MSIPSGTAWACRLSGRLLDIDVTAYRHRLGHERPHYTPPIPGSSLAKNTFVARPKRLQLDMAASGRVIQGQPVVVPRGQVEWRAGVDPLAFAGAGQATQGATEETILPGHHVERCLAVAIEDQHRTVRPVPRTRTSRWPDDLRRRRGHGCVLDAADNRGHQGKPDHARDCYRREALKDRLAINHQIHVSISPPLSHPVRLRQQRAGGWRLVWLGADDPAIAELPVLAGMPILRAPGPAIARHPAPAAVPAA